MAICSAKNKGGQQCRMAALTGSHYCFAHDPARGRERAQARRTGGKRRRVSHAENAAVLPARVGTVADVLAILDYTLREALPLENSVQRGRLLVAICGAFVEAIKIGEFESRLSAIERALGAREEQP